MLSREQRAFENRLVRLYKQITHADLTAAVNGTAQAIALGTVQGLGILLSSSVKLNTFFTGGSATTCTMAIGVAGTAAKIKAALNVLDTTATGIWLPGTAGTQPEGRYGGVPLIATFTPDAGYTLLALTAGDLEVEMVFAGGADLNSGF